MYDDYLYTLLVNGLEPPQIYRPCSQTLVTTLSQDRLRWTRPILSCAADRKNAVDMPANGDI